MRRQAQVKRARPDLEVVGFRGNVETRLAKLEAGVADATFLAAAGLNRLQQAHRIAHHVPTSQMLPAVAQGAIAIELNEGDRRAIDLVQPLDHRPTATAIAAERAFLARLDGSCRTPIAGHATVSAGRLHFRGMIVKPDGSQAFETTRDGDIRDADKLGADAGAELKGRAGPDFFSSH